MIERFGCAAESPHDNPSAFWNDDGPTTTSCRPCGRLTVKVVGLMTVHLLLALVIVGATLLLSLATRRWGCGDRCR